MSRKSSKFKINLSRSGQKASNGSSGGDGLHSQGDGDFLAADQRTIPFFCLKLRLAWEARDGLKGGRETRDYKTAKFVEACFEAAPQMLLQTVALVSLWNDEEARRSDIFVAFSILNSVFSVSWETMSALDRCYAHTLCCSRTVTKAGTCLLPEREDNSRAYTELAS